MGDEQRIARAIALMGQADSITSEANLRVGRWVLDGFFGGDPGAVRSRSPTKAQSYASLVERAWDAVEWDEDRIRRAVCAEIVARELGEAVAGKLKYSQLAQLYAVDDPAVRQQLAGQIASGELKGNQAKMAIARAAMVESHGGRKPRPAVDLALGEVERAWRRAKRAGAFEAANLAGLAGAAVLGLAKRARRLEGEIGGVAATFEEAGRRPGRH